MSSKQTNFDKIEEQIEIEQNYLYVSYKHTDFEKIEEQIEIEQNYVYVSLIKQTSIRLRSKSHRNRIIVIHI